MEEVLSNDNLVYYIYSFLSSTNEKTSIACVNRDLNKICKNRSSFAIKQENLEFAFAFHGDNLSYCINNNCINEKNNYTENPIYPVSYKPMNNLIFFYPKFLTKREDNENNLNNENNVIIEWIRYNECLNGAKIKRFIPYCKNCMHRYVNYGYREDGDKIQYGHTCQYIMNI